MYVVSLPDQFSHFDLGLIPVPVISYDVPHNF